MNENTDSPETTLSHSMRLNWNFAINYLYLLFTIVMLHLYIVACRPVARQRLRNKQIYGSRYCVTASQIRFFVRQQLEAAREEWYFLFGPCRDVISMSYKIGHETCATLFLGNIITETLPSSVKDPQIWDSKIWSWGLRYSEPRMTAQARPSSNCTLQTRSFVIEGAPYKRTCNFLRVINKPDCRLTVGRIVTLILTFVNTGARTLLGSITRQRLVKTQQTIGVYLFIVTSLNPVTVAHMWLCILIF
jgi:hypothetical protein